MKEQNNYDFLKDKCFIRLNSLNLYNDIYINRLNEELLVIKECEVENFILNTAYATLLLKSNDIFLGPSRGSSAGSLVCYLIGITDIDPIQYNLSFARFLNKTRMKTQMPDIDEDLNKKDRPKALRILKNAFGADKTCQIINDVYFSRKTAIKDLGRIFGISYQKTNKITALLGDNNIDEVPEVQLFLEDHPQIKDNLLKLEGLIRNSSTHAGGIIVSDSPLTNYISTLNSGDSIVSCYNGKICESIGFLKMDMLGLQTLDIIKDCLTFIGRKKFDFNYDLDDINVYKTINKSTLGIFQLESIESASYVKEMIPNSFKDIIACLALVRPGSKNSGDADKFLRIRFGKEKLIYDHPLLEPILKDTNSTILFQEQSMQISKVISGFTDIEADLLRRAISKKLTYVFDEYKPKFIEGAKKNNIDEDVANLIWNKIEESSNYSFNKSHAVGYSMITYQTAYLKTYYPMEFYTSMLNNVESEEKRNKIYNEIKNLDKNLINPDINNSGEVCMYTEDSIYLSFSLINGVGPAATKAILENQPYQSFEDFMNRKTSKVNKGVVKALIEAGAFDRFNSNRDELYSIIDDNEHHWSEKEVLFREFQRIKINPKNNLLDLYDTQEMNIIHPISSVSDLKNNTEGYNDFYVKLLPSEFNKKDNHAFVSVTDGFDNISLFVGKEFVSRYIDSLNEIGLPLLCHVHGKGEKYSLVSLIKLDDIKYYQHEYLSYTYQSIEKVKLLQEANPGINVGYISNISYFVSKNGNPCARYDITISSKEVLEGRITVNPPLMCEGSFIFFNMGDNPIFPNIIQIA